MTSFDPSKHASSEEMLRRLSHAKARLGIHESAAAREWLTLPAPDRAAAIKVLAHAIDLRARNGMPESAGLAALMRIAKGEG